MKAIWLGCLLGLGVVCAEVEHRETKQMSYTLSPGGKLIVDNVFGGVKVTGHSGRDLKIAVQEYWRADTDEKLAEARREVKLDAGQSGDTVRLYVDGPFRCQDGGTRWDGDRGYTVRHEFEITAPIDTAMVLKTVNGGDISVRNVRGQFEVRNVNGSIELKDAATGGIVHTVNGRIDVTFAENPTTALSVKTINGTVATEFLPNLSADFRFKTMHGQVYTDYDVAALPAEPLKIQHDGKRSIYRSNHFTGVRIGAGGGPEHRFETLNGSIRILKRGN